jgi:sec-independent protein translocase protein TatA
MTLARNELLLIDGRRRDASALGKENTMPNIGPLELVFVLVIALVLLGPKRLPAAAQSLGRSIDEFRRGLTAHAEERPSTQEPSDEDTTQLAGRHRDDGRTADVIRRDRS